MIRRDFSMPGDITRKRKTEGYAAIVGVGAIDANGMVRISTACNVESLVADLQKGTWFELYYRQLVWVPGLTAARTVADGVERLLESTGHLVRDHWYRAEETLVDELIEAQIQSLRCRSWSHAQLVEQLRSELRAEARAFAEGRI